MSDLTFETLNDALVEAFPELKENYQKELEWRHHDDPGAHNIYGDVFVPYVVDALGKPEDNQELLVRAFALLERLAAHKDEHVQEVAGATVIEALLSARKVSAEAKRRMGPESLKIANDIENWRPSG